jgi:EAL domain-containing protein (putative c-di-GMP-specific phosphodiesterase class I)
VIGRVSENGFAIVRDDLTDKREILEFAESLHHEIVGTGAQEAYECHVTPRIGVACYPHDDATGHGLLEKAEIALEQAARNPYFGPQLYSTSVHVSAANRARMARDLRIAVDNGDLYLEYQPKFEVRSHELIGLEALLRWRSPDHGLIPPSEFIPLAEENGLILAIGDNVLYRACQQSRHWSEAGCYLVPIAVNISGHQLQQKNIVSRITNILDSFSLEYEYIEVEVTESVALENSPHIQSALAGFRDLGINTAIDDFGTGYSSLGSLRDFSFQSLKIDRSFVSDLNDGRGADSIVKSMITMAHTLGMTVVAEGVEREKQLDFLRHHDCDVVQGFLTGRPVSADCIQAMLM